MCIHPISIAGEGGTFPGHDEAASETVSDRMDEGDVRKLFDPVFRTQIPRVMHEYFCVPQYTGWEDETISYAERCGLFPREREYA